ncbi:MAG: pseudouridine-5'-phosphate glycosidase [bacterium]
MIEIKNEIKAALAKKEPVVALESTIITHGLPYPQNLETAQLMEDAVRKEGAYPAMIAVLEGKLKVGLSRPELEKLISQNPEKVQASNLAFVLSKKLSGGTTVSATIEIAHSVGIPVFATGGIGGVHRNAETTFDISQDLTSLARTPVCIISSGAKAILDLPRTLELLETLGIPIFGYRTSIFPAFYTANSGLKIKSVESPEEVAQTMFLSWKILKINRAILVCNPPPEEKELSFFYVEELIKKALQSAEKLKVTGKDLTPFLLSYLDKSSGGRTVETNIALAEANAHLGAKIAKAYTKMLLESFLPPEKKMV